MIDMENGGAEERPIWPAFAERLARFGGCEFLCKAGGLRPSTALKRDGGKLLFRPSIIDPQS